MAIPVLEKGWTFDVNNYQNSRVTTTDMKEILLGWKNAMVATGFWSVMLSSDSVSSGASDLWVDTTDLVWGTTGARSWIVLRNANFFGAGKHLEIMFECRWASSTYISNMSLWYSPTGDYSGGNTTTLPTATTSVGPLIAISADATNLIQRGGGGVKPKNWHLMWSTDGQCFRYILCQQGIATAVILIDRMKNPVAGLDDVDTFIAFVKPDGDYDNPTEKLTLEKYNAAAGCKSFVDAAALEVAYYMTSEYVGSTPLVEGLVAGNPDDGGAWLLSPMGLVTITNSASAYGRNAEVFDLWWGPAPPNSDSYVNSKTGHTYPNDGSRTFVQFGDMVFPWDGSKVAIS